MTKKKTNFLIPLVFGIICFLLASFTKAEVAIPPLRARVTDLTGTLSADQRTSLEQKLEALEREKGSQVVVLILPTTVPEAIEQFSVRLEEQWKIGRGKISDGVILVVAKNDRKVRIEVGYGLEGAIPDAIAKRIIEEQIIPNFKNGDFNQGINAGCDSIIARIKGEELPPPPASGFSNSSSSSQPEGDPSFVMVIVGIISSSILSLFSLKQPWVGILAAVAAALMGFALSAPIWIIIIFAFIVFLISLGQGSGGRYSSSSSGWSSGGSSGGFSGGGGSSGGGGASGSW